MDFPYKDYVTDISNSITDISDFIKGMNYDEFVEDKKTVFAVIRALEIIGEATKNIPDSIRDSYPVIPWKSMAGMRDKLIHAYFGVRLELVWNTVSKLLPTLNEVFQQISLDFNDESLVDD